MKIRPSTQGIRKKPALFGSNWMDIKVTIHQIACDSLSKTKKVLQSDTLMYVAYDVYIQKEEGKRAQENPIKWAWESMRVP